MPCSTTCMLAVALIISSIYFQNVTAKSKIVKEYKSNYPLIYKMYMKNISRKIAFKLLWL